MAAEEEPFSFIPKNSSTNPNTTTLFGVPIDYSTLTHGLPPSVPGQGGLLSSGGAVPAPQVGPNWEEYHRINAEMAKWQPRAIQQQTAWANNPKVQPFGNENIPGQMNYTQSAFGGPPVMLPPSMQNPFGTNTPVDHTSAWAQSAPNFGPSKHNLIKQTVALVKGCIKIKNTVVKNQDTEPNFAANMMNLLQEKQGQYESVLEILRSPEQLQSNQLIDIEKNLNQEKTNMLQWEGQVNSTLVLPKQTSFHTPHGRGTSKHSKKIHKHSMKHKRRRKKGTKKQVKV